jgi:hypothetical protein
MQKQQTIYQWAIKAPLVQHKTTYTVSQEDKKMSDHNNIYNIMSKLEALKPEPETAKQTAQRIYESVEAKGSILEGVKGVEQNLNEKYMGFKAVEKSAKKGGAENPAAVAAAVGRKKYGKAAFQKAAAAGKKMGEDQVDEGMFGGIDHASVASNLAKLARVIKSVQTPEQFKVAREYARRMSGTIMKHQHDNTTFGSGLKANLAVMRDIHADLKAKAAELGMEFDPLAEERETLKTKGGTIYKGGTYGTHYDGDDAPKKEKHVPRKGVKGRKPKDPSETPKFDAPKGDIFGRTTGKAPAGKPGKTVKGHGTSDKSRNPKADAEFDRDDKVDEVIDMDTLNQLASHPMAGPLAAAGGAAIGAAVGKGIKKLAGAHKYFGSNQKDKANPKPAMAEGRNTVGQLVLESVNFKKMMDECDMTMAEMLECINQDIQAYKTTGDMTDRLRDFMHLHNHAKKQMEEAGPVPYEVPAVQRKAAGAAPLTPGDVQAQDAERSMHPGMTKLDAPKPAVHDELNELAKLAGITDESMCNECGMYESQCSCQEGNLFTKHLKDTPDGGDFEIDGKHYKDTSSLEEMAKLAGIFKEGKDYGDTSFNEPPVYSNSPDEQVQSEDVLLKGGDGEVAGGEKKMNSMKPTFKNGDNALAEDTALMKPAAEFDFVESMGRNLMQAYEGIKTK